MKKFGLLSEELDNRLRAICINATGTTYLKFTHGNREHETILAKQMYQYFLHEELDIKKINLQRQYKTVENLAGYDHSNIIHSIQTINNHMHTNRLKKKLIEDTLKKMKDAYNIFNRVYTYPYQTKPVEYKLLKPLRHNHKTNISYV